MRVTHIAWNLLGLTLPLCVAVLAVPPLLDSIGEERFGLLALAWGLIGYATALDFGLGRALTQLISKQRGEGKTASIPSTLTTASRITFSIGVMAGVFIAIFGALGGGDLIHTQSTPQAEITLSILLLAVALPAQAISSTYKGLNEAFLNFKGISLLRSGLGIINFAGPYAICHFTTQLQWLVFSLVISRLVSLFLYKWLATKCISSIKVKTDAACYSPRIAKDLLSFGSWATISSVISPIMVQADRFFLASMISAAAVSSYVIPYEIIIQSLVIVGAITTVIFPNLSRMIQEHPDKCQSYFRKWLLRVAIVMTAVCITLAVSLPSILALWLGTHLGQQSILAGRILCVGVLSSSIGAMYYAFIQAHGRADITAKFHLIQLPLFAISMYLSVSNWGVAGAAIAWTARSLLDTILLVQFTRRKLKYREHQ